jgi:hypothetical protein
MRSAALNPSKVNLSTVFPDSEVAPGGVGPNAVRYDVSLALGEGVEYERFKASMPTVKLVQLTRLRDGSRRHGAG